MLRGSPFSLPSEESYIGPWVDPIHQTFACQSFSDALQDLPDFDPQAIRRRAGGKLRDVQVLAARAHSMLSPSEFQELRFAIGSPMYGGSFPRNSERIKKLAHVFDVEHAKSVPLLNELVGHIAEASGVPRWLRHSSGVKKADTGGILHFERPYSGRRLRRRLGRRPARGHEQRSPSLIPASALGDYQRSERPRLRSRTGPPNRLVRYQIFTRIIELC